MRTWFCDGQTHVQTYGWIECCKIKNNMSPHPQGRDIISNNYISRVYWVHFHLLTSDTFPVYFVYPIAFTSYTGLNSLCVNSYKLRVYWFIAEHKKKKKKKRKKRKKKKKKRYFRNHWIFFPETFIVLRLLSVTINETHVVTVAGCTLMYGKTMTIFLIKKTSHNVWSTLNPICTILKRIFFQWTIDSYQKLYWMPLPLCQDAANATRLLWHYAFTKFGRTSIAHCEIDERINVRLHLWNYAILEEKN